MQNFMFLINRNSDGHFYTFVPSPPSKTQQALWEYNKILESLHTLKFIDDPEYRQAIRGVLNRIEGYHQLLSKIGGVHGGKFRGSTELSY